MDVYLVRHIETKEVQGLFWGTLDEIWDQLDELTDPLGFEYARLKAGALYNTFQIGEGRVVDPDLSFDWSDFFASETFREELHGARKLRWKPFDATDQGHGLLARMKAR